MGTPIKLGFSAGAMTMLKTYLTGKDGANCPLVLGFHLSLGCACSGNKAAIGTKIIPELLTSFLFFSPRNCCSAQNGSQLDIKVNRIYFNKCN